MRDDVALDFSLDVAREFIDNAPCGFISFDDNGSVQLVNNALLDLLRYDREEIERMHFDRMLTVAGRIFFQTHFFPLLKLRGRVDEIYLSLKTKGGEDIPMLVNASRHQDPSGVTINHCVLLSMRERRRFEDELISARKQVEEAARAKDAFMAMVSHELRTPLTAIVGWLHILRENLEDPEVSREAVTVIERNTTIQTTLIEDLLDFSRIQTGKMRLEVQLIEPEVMIRDAIDVVRPAALAKEITISTLLDSAAGPVMGDANRLQQVIWNLLSNAVKFTPKRGEVSVVLRRVSSHAEIMITDTGGGIDPQFLPFVFEQFRQEDDSRTRKYGGLGLGLSISKEIVELHGGTIQANSDGSGQGATFTIHLPIPSVQSIQKGSPSIDSPQPGASTMDESASPNLTRGTRSLAGLQIFVVDDKQESLTMVSRILEEAGARVTLATNAQAMLLELESVVPDILLADIGMPDMDGYQLLERVRASPPPLSQVPAIALSALVTTADRTRAIDVGYQAFLSKPVDPRELVHTLSRIAGREV